MRTAAVLGQRVEFDVLAAVTGLGEAELVGALRAPVERSLLVESQPDRFTFRHAVTREAVVGTLFGRERRRLHEKALAGMQEMGSNDFAALAHHAQESGRLGEMVDLARQGATTYLKQGSAVEALRLAETGLSHAPEDLDLLSVATRSARTLGVIDVATLHARRWHAAAAVRGEVAVQLAALYQLGRIRWAAADSVGHANAVRAALTLAEADGTPSALSMALAMAGGGQTNLTNNAAGDTLPSWSADGTKIAFTRLSNPLDLTTGEVWVMNFDGSGQTQLTFNSAFDGQPYWSPDGTKIVFNSERDAVGSNDSDVWVMSSDGSHQHALTTGTDVNARPTWSADGKFIAFASDRDGDFEIFTMRTNGTSQTQLTFNSAFDTRPDISPNSKSISFMSDRDGNNEIYSMSKNGSNQLNLSNNAASDANPAYSPDGKKLLFDSDRDTAGASLETYSMRTNGGTVVRLTTNASNDFFADWQAA